MLELLGVDDFCNFTRSDTSRGAGTYEVASTRSADLHKHKSDGKIKPHRFIPSEES